MIEKNFKTECPEVAKQWHPTLNGERKPEDFAPYSGKKAWWHCDKCGGDWEALISSRAIGRGCPYCTGKLVLRGFNDLESQMPEVAIDWHPTKNGPLLPSAVTVHSNRKVWWRCSKCGAEWETSICHRSSGRGCPKCASKARGDILTKKNLITGVNDLKTLHPELAAEWDYSKNTDGPEEYSQCSTRKKWWICPKGHSYDIAISSRTSQGQGCPYCASKRVLAGFNDLQTLYPEIAAEWDFEKNDKEPSEVMSKSSYNAYWICPKGHSFQVKVSERTTNYQTKYCPICSGKRVVSGYNDLATVRPEIAAQWDYDKNGDFFPTEVTEFSGKRAWWVCERGHSWSAVISWRTKGNGCPYCGNSRLMPGFNDVAALFPEIAKEWSWKNEKMPSEYIAGSHSKVRWKCSKCGYEWDSVIKERTYRSSGCPRCTHYFKTSIPEQAIYYYVKQVYPDAVNSFSGEESGNREIDVFIPSLQLGIEYDGGFWHTNSEKDKRKTQTLHENGIELIRVRERQAGVLEDGSVQILADTSSDDLNKVQPALEELFDILSQRFGLAKQPDIDLDRDYNEILDLSEGNQFDKSLASTNSPILQEWDYTKNDPITPEKVTAYSHKKAWWICSKCGKSWKQIIKTKIKGGLYCESCNKTAANRKKAIQAISEGKAVPLTEYPLLAEEWFDEDDIALYTYGSDKKARWKCRKCGNIFFQVIKNRTLQGQGCPLCANKAKGRSGKKEVKNLETGEVFGNIREAAEKYKISISAIGCCVNGIRNTAGGYHWAFYDDGEVTSEKELPEQMTLFK